MDLRNRIIDQSTKVKVILSGSIIVNFQRSKNCVHDTETSLHATQYDSNPMQIDLQGALGLFILK